MITKKERETNTITIKINTKNKAFKDFNEEVELILNFVIIKLLQGQTFMSINDSNGNKVGFCQVLKGETNQWL